MCLGRNMKYKDEKKYIGNREQLVSVKRVKMQEGKASGTDLITVQNRSGMHFDVNVSRGLDITNLDFLGENFGYISPCGIVAPEYFDDKGLGFLKSFTAGFMTTCGLKTAGAPGEYNGEEYGLHGNISHTPAEEVICVVEEQGDDVCVVIKGKMKDAIIFGDKLSLEREIRCEYKARKITIKDKVVNEGFNDARHMILYHCNIGYPLLTPDSKVFIPAQKTEARNEHSKAGIKTWMKAEQPDSKYEEMCYYHDLQTDKNAMTAVAVFNEVLDMGVAIEFDTKTLDHFVQWKMMGEGDYVMGLEPCNTTIDGVADAIQNGSLKHIKPGQSIEHSLTFNVLAGEKEFEALKNRF